jgi:hypothetical protein
MSAPFIVVIVVGIAGLFVQWLVLRAASTEIRLRTQGWLERAAAGAFRRQTRDDAIAELERALTLTPSAIALRRLGIMAPLLGVVLTAGSVMFSKASLATLVNVSETTTVVKIMEGLLPLLAGVTAGALLAIFNQLLLIVFHRAEDRLMNEAVSMLKNGWFRDTDDRVELVVEQIAGLGEAIAQMQQRIASVVQVTIDSGERLGMAISTVSKGLEKAASDFAEVIATPAREFKASAEEISKTAKVGWLAYQKVAEAFEQVHETGFGRIAEVQRQQMETLRAEMASLEQLQALLGGAAQLRLPDWNSSFDAASDAANSFGESMTTLVASLRARNEDVKTSLAQSSDLIRETMTRLNGSLTDFETRCRQGGEAAAAASLRPEEIAKVRDGLRELSEALVVSLRNIQSLNGAAASPRRNSGFSWFRAGS